MSRARSRLLASLAVVGSVTLAALTRPAILRAVHGSLPRFVYAQVPLTPEAYDALAAHPSWSKTSLSVAPGVTLNGLVRRPKRKDVPWVVFFPGNDPSQLTAGQDVLERIAQNRDLGLIVYADRGYDSSGGKPSAETLRDDAYQKLLCVFNREHVEPAKVHAVAFSMGGYGAVAAVGRAAREHKVVASLSTMAAVEKMEMVSSVWMGRIAVGDIIDTLPLLDDVPGPVLVIHGSDDTTLPIAQGRAIAARLGSRARFLEIAGKGHLDLPHSEDAIAAIRSVIDGASPPR